MKLLIILSIALFCLSGCTAQDSSNYSSERTTYEVEVNNMNSSHTISQTPTEQELYVYKTTIYTKTEERQNNVQLACQQLTGTIVAPGETFSFCDTLGPAQPEDGYQKAESFDSDGDIIQEYGGGKCQISTTLYNAVKDMSGIEIVERHEHSNDVPYIAEGLDAAVAYGSVDFKFKNNNSYSLKIIAEATPDEVTVRIMRLS